MRLIDADELLNKTANLEAVALEQVAKYEPSENPREWHRWTGILQERTAFKYDLMDAPTVDAVQVVRCKDCKYYEETDSRIGTCLLTISGAEVDGFCAWGEWGGDGDAV